MLKEWQLKLTISTGSLVGGTVEPHKKLEAGSVEARSASFERKREIPITPPRVLTSPVHQLIIIILTVFCAEMVVTLSLAKLPLNESLYLDAFLGSLMLIAITFPTLYFVMLRPMRQHITEFRQVEKALRESETFLQAIIETAPECIKLISSEGKVLTMNRAGLAMIEADSLDEVKGKSVYGIINPEHCEAFKKLTGEVFRGQSGRLQFEIIGTKGKRLWLETYAVPLRDEKGEIVFLLGITRDITERLHIEQALSESEEKYRSLVESTDDSIYVVDRNYRYLYMNKKHMTRMGFVQGEYFGRAYGEFHRAEATGPFTSDVDKVFETGEPVRREYKSNRDNQYFAQTLSPVKHTTGHIVAVTVISKDITERKTMEEKLRTLSLTDELTGLYNRRGFFTFCEQFLKLCKRQKKGAFLLYADLDNLKEINDRFGHQEGDKVLVETADIFKKTFRESDILARVGGDEFIVIPVGSTKDYSEVIIKRFLHNIESHNTNKASQYTLSISFGTSYYDPQYPRSIDELVAEAEKLMYERKKDKQS